MIQSAPWLLRKNAVLFKKNDTMRRLFQRPQHRWRPLSRLYHELSFTQPGSPRKVLDYRRALDVSPPPPEDLQRQRRWVLVEMMAAPWNPADALTVQGAYPSPFWDDDAASSVMPRREGPTVAGSEGWGRIVNVSGGAEDSSSSTHASLQIGDFVVPGLSGLGTLRSALWTPDTHWIRLARGKALLDQVGPGAAAALFQTAGTAWRMLHDFVRPGAGGGVIQNAGNSAVGFMVSQIAKEILQVPCISLIRTGNRTPEQVRQLQDYLMEQGKASMVLTEESITPNSVAPILDAMRTLGGSDADTTTPLEASFRHIPLALNAVGGSSVDKLLLFLQKGGTMVTYGGMSREPITVDTSQFIFRNITLAGYWHSRWMVQQHLQHIGGLDARATMMNALVDAVLGGRLACPPVQIWPLSDFQRALAAPSEIPTVRQKIVFDCRDEEEEEN